MANQYDNLATNFIDLDNGRTFNGMPPFHTFRFPKGQSIGLWYVLPVCFITSQEQVTVSVEPGQDVFDLLDLNGLPDDPMNPIDRLGRPEEEGGIPLDKMNMKVYVDLERLICPDKTFQSVGFQYVTSWITNPDQSDPDAPSEIPQDWFWVHMVYILAHAEDPGEYLGSWNIRYNDTEENYLVLADFYGENEVLKENLGNLESRLPESIQKAIYENNVHEDLADNILLNRKNKELLMEYIKIMANKGSYEGIINSVNWFEWGDLLRLEEYWKRYLNDELSYNYMARDFNSILSPEDIRQLSNQVKTTFIGLYCTLAKIQTVRGHLVYQDTFGRDNIQPHTDWGDRDSSWRHLPGDYYENYPELEPASIEPTEDDPNVDEAEVSIVSHNNYVQLADPANNPGIMWKLAGYESGAWAYNENTHQWAYGNQSGSDWTYYHINFNHIWAEQMPNLINVATLWTAQDLSLKMTLVGNFLSTFFLPIHIDLIHSCIECWTFGYALKQIYSQMIDQRGEFECFAAPDMVWESDLKIIPHPEAKIFPTTLFRTINSEGNLVFGFDIDNKKYLERVNNMDNQDPTPEHIEAMNKDMLLYYWKGECCKVRFIGKIYTESKDPNISLFRERLVWMRKEDYSVGEIISQVGVEPHLEKVHDSIPTYAWGRYVRDNNEWVLIDNDNMDEYRLKRLETYSEEQVIGLDFNLGFKKDGEYMMDFEFYTSNNKIWHKRFKISVSESMSNKIEVMKLEHLDGIVKAWEQLESPISLYQMSDIPVSYKETFDHGVKGKADSGSGLDRRLQTHFLSADLENSDAGLNHTLITIVKKDYGFDGDTEFDPGMDETIWNNGTETVDGSEAAGSSWEGGIIEWEMIDPEDSGNRIPAVWSHSMFIDSYYNDYGEDWNACINYWNQKIPGSWDPIPTDLDAGMSYSQELDGTPIPVSTSPGKLNNLVEMLKETFPEYWWSWDRIQISERDGLQVQSSVSAFPNGVLYPKNVQTKLWPDEF